jgi:hypothetical protein
MYVTATESRVLSRIFGLLSEDLSEHDVREAVGHHLLELLEADYYASYVWQEKSGRFDKAAFLNMDPKNLAAYEAYFQYHDPITFKLQARREATLVTQVMPQRELMRTEFFNDFLARDGLHWGINLHAFDGERALGDLRIWRSRTRREFEAHDQALLDLIDGQRVAQAVPGGAVDLDGAAARDAVDGGDDGSLGGHAGDGRLVGDAGRVGHANDVAGLDVGRHHVPARATRVVDLGQPGRVGDDGRRLGDRDAVADHLEGVGDARRTRA